MKYIQYDVCTCGGIKKQNIQMDAQQSPAVDRPVYTPRIPHRAAGCGSGRLIGRLTNRCVVGQKCKEEEGYFIIMQTSSRPSSPSSSSFCVLHKLINKPAERGTDEERLVWVGMNLWLPYFYILKIWKEQFVWFMAGNLKRFFGSSPEKTTK